ncbi:hypothetical protein Q1695_010864 [Nippostrongylus brasiliensis]|nr:hypothetical protein Q1695_010864 [Nippostrongylus brasiliensis]
MVRKKGLVFNIVVLLAIPVLPYSLQKRPLIEVHSKSRSSPVQGFSPLCTACTAAIATMSVVVKWDKTEPVILEFAKVICNLVAKQSWAICDGITTQFRDEFFYVFRQLSDRSSAEICGILLPECGDPNDPNQSGWNVALPPRPNGTMRNLLMRKKVKSAHQCGSEQRYLRALQLTDIHIDFEYEPGSEVDCGVLICCRKSEGVVRKPAGFWGSVGRCDIPYHTFKNMLEHINATDEVDYIMLSGDFVNHADWDYSKDEHVAALRNISSLIRQYFPATPTYWAIGNHEGVPVNSFAPHSVDERFWPEWLYEEFRTMSAPWLSDDESKIVLFRGSYSVRVADGLRLISLNSGFCETTNFFLYLNQSDPDGTMSWFVAELYKAELSGEAVHVLSHIPPGDGECLEGWARNYYRVIQRFSDTIRAQFFGHVHLDYFTMFYEDMHNVSSKPVGVLYAAPSVTTYADMNPAYRIYDIDFSDGFKVADIKNYFADIGKATEQRAPRWRLLYSAKEAYDLPELSLAAWNSVANTVINGTTRRTVKRFFRNAFRVKDPSCDIVCQRNLLCSLRMGHHNSTLYCPPASWTSYSLRTNRITP